MRKIKLTKKRLKALDMAISMDDVLYEKYRRLNEDLEKRAVKMYKSQQVINVIRKVNGNHYIEKIIKEDKTYSGIIVYIE